MSEVCVGRRKGYGSYVEERVNALAEALFCLEEPWRDRFLLLVANMANDWAWDERLPEREDLIDWLRANQDLYREVKYMLDMWQCPQIQSKILTR